MKICDFSANMYHMNMIFRFLESLLLGLSLECFLIIFGHFFEILCHFEFDVYFWAADSLPISQKWKYGENHPKYHLMNIFLCLLENFVFLHNFWLRCRMSVVLCSERRAMSENYFTYPYYCLTIYQTLSKTTWKFIQLKRKNVH